MRSVPKRLTDTLCLVKIYVQKVAVGCCLMTVRSSVYCVRLNDSCLRLIFWYSESLLYPIQIYKKRSNTLLSQ